jgi:hypothetical protein
MKDRCWCGGKVSDTACVDSVFHHPFATGRPEKIEVLYVAGPMSGYPDSNYPAFSEAADRLADAGFKVVNPATAVVGTEAHYVDFIREDLRMMLDCHGVATLDNWWESTGARNEVNVAGILKMPVRTVADWLERAARELS